MQVLSAAAVALFALAAAGDIARRRIPNPLVLALAFAGLARLGLAAWGGASPVALGIDIAAALAIFAAGAGLFAAGLLGGGDAKLLGAGSLWLGAEGTGAFLMVTVLAGGLLALVFLALRLIRRGGPETALPYGVAIAAGGILTTLGFA
ncbi:prepilin peptidase [uncultured Amaricoccus sp.]|uniref:prepilin peptidase n=1 Tax=uncultured Amaricoccus sp. TaxID=339341 RepID=UPI00261423C8|nr:prepilin peptidase [uncultured Amaricoccus sp.]